jgi:hypothetical protein
MVRVPIGGVVTWVDGGAVGRRRRWNGALAPQGVVYGGRRGRVVVSSVIHVRDVAIVARSILEIKIIVSVSISRNISQLKMVPCRLRSLLFSTMPPSL